MDMNLRRKGYYKISDIKSLCIFLNGWWLSIKIPQDIQSVSLLKCQYTQKTYLQLFKLLWTNLDVSQKMVERSHKFSQCWEEASKQFEDDHSLRKQY